MRGNNVQALLCKYEQFLYEEERSQNTVQKYLRDVRAFFSFLQDRAICKAEVLSFKAQLVARYAPASVNSMLAAVNGFLCWQGFAQCRVKPLKIQRDIFANPAKELTQREYQRLVQAAAARRDPTLSLLLQTICASGIRVSELRYITVRALQTGRANVQCKGKNRVIFLPKALCKTLRGYCQQKHILEGSVFVSRAGKPLDRSNIWKMMKCLCKAAHVAREKVFPHNLRHLFARTYYKIEKDIGKLADILGHSSINTTRIYTMETGAIHARQLDKMQLLYPLA